MPISAAFTVTDNDGKRRKLRNVTSLSGKSITSICGDENCGHILTKSITAVSQGSCECCQNGHAQP